MLTLLRYFERLYVYIIMVYVRFVLYCIAWCAVSFHWLEVAHRFIVLTAAVHRITRATSELRSRPRNVSM